MMAREVAVTRRKGAKILSEREPICGGGGEKKKKRLATRKKDSQLVSASPAASRKQPLQLGAGVSGGVGGKERGEARFLKLFKEFQRQEVHHNPRFR